MKMERLQSVDGWMLVTINALIAAQTKRLVARNGMEAWCHIRNKRYKA
jgi:hypothetical protein